MSEHHRDYFGRNPAGSDLKHRSNPLPVTHDGNTYLHAGHCSRCCRIPNCNQRDTMTGINTTTVSITNLTGTNFLPGATVMLTPLNVNPVHSGSIADGNGGALT